MTREKIVMKVKKKNVFKIRRKKLHKQRINNDKFSIIHRG